MREKNNYLVHISLILIMFITLYDTAKCQDIAPSQIIVLPKGCKLFLDSNIDLTDTVSKNIVNGIRSIIPRIQSLIPLDSISVKLAIGYSNVLPFIGVGGRTNMNNSDITIEYYYDPGNPNFKIESLINGLVHECHHASRFRMPNWELTLLELMIMEGLADHFLIEVTNCEQPRWSRALTEEEIKQYMIKAKPILFIKQESWTKEFDEWLIFGRKGADSIPGWTGYSLGWVIVENYLKTHPEALASTLVFTPAKEIANSTIELKVDNEK